MSIVPDAVFCSLGEAVKALWCQDPVLSGVIPPERFYEYGASMAAPKPPYAIYRQGAANQTLNLGDSTYYSVILSGLKIYAGSEIWQLAKQARILFSNVGCLKSLEGSTSGVDCIPGPVRLMPGGIYLVEHTLKFKLVEFRDPQRLRMT